MYDHISFPNERELAFRSKEELASLANAYQYTTNKVDIRDIVVNDNGTVTWPGHEQVPITEHGFRHFCKLLRIPDPFAKHIPWDLLQHNIRELTHVTSKEASVHFYEDDGQPVIANIARGDFTPVPHTTFLEVFADRDLDFVRGIISDHSLSIETTSELEGFGDIQVQVGDITKTGIKFYNSVTGFIQSRALLFLYRLVCTNGCTLPMRQGVAKLRMKAGRNLDVVLGKFIRDVEQLLTNQEKIKECFAALQAPLAHEQFVQYWKGLNKIVVDPEYVDEQLMGVSEDIRKLVFAEVKAVKAEDITPDEFSTVLPLGYTIYNNVTSEAQTFRQLEREKLESYAGKILAHA